MSTFSCRLKEYFSVLSLLSENQKQISIFISTENEYQFCKWQPFHTNFPEGISICWIYSVQFYFLNVNPVQEAKLKSYMRYIHCWLLLQSHQRPMPQVAWQCTQWNWDWRWQQHRSSGLCFQPVLKLYSWTCAGFVWMCTAFLWDHLSDVKILRAE